MAVHSLETSADRPLRGLAFMLFASASFTTMNATAALLARRGIPWEMAAFARAFLGLFVALSVARARGVSLGVRDRRVMWTRSIAGSTSMVLTFYALTHMPLADATALLNTTPLWIAALAWFVLGERPGRAVLAALAIAIIGVFFVEQPGFTRGELAGLVALGAGAASAVAMVSLRRLGDEPPEAIVVHFSSVASVVTATALVSRVARGAPVQVPSNAIDWLCLASVGITATVGQLALTRAYALDRAARVGAAGWAQVVLALVVDGALRATWPSRSALGGIALLLSAGVLLVASAQRDQRVNAAAERASREGST
ncbi:MAG: DMT family transporter [Myxococcales bacterium]|nr:DMT family transporter [Myxococcales bacterium]